MTVPTGSVLNKINDRGFTFITVDPSMKSTRTLGLKP